MQCTVVERTVAHYVYTALESKCTVPGTMYTTIQFNRYRTSLSMFFPIESWLASTLMTCVSTYVWYTVHMYPMSYELHAPPFCVLYCTKRTTMYVCMYIKWMDRRTDFKSSCLAFSLLSSLLEPTKKIGDHLQGVLYECYSGSNLTFGHHNE